MNQDEVRDILLAGLERLRLPAGAQQLAQLCRYCLLVEETNRHLNLTALRSAGDVARGLVLDSLALTIALPPIPTGERHQVVDVGSGAGVPGIPFAILYPTWTFTLVESVGKKARFIKEACSSLGLTNIEVKPERAEVLGRLPAYRDRADLCLARAVAPLPTLLEYCAPLVAPGGHLLLAKSADIEDEVASAARAAEVLRLELVRLRPVPVFSGRSEHVAFLYRKLGPTPDLYPRRIGLPKSRPIGAERARAD